MSYSKYYLYKKQYSNDSGTTWYDVTPLEQVPSGSPIATYDTLQECNGGGTDYSSQYLTFVALESGTFKFSGNSINYSLDSGATWATIESDADSPTVQSGNKIMWKGELTPVTSSPYGIGRFSSTNNFTVEGNAMSLLYGDNFENQTDLSEKSYAFYRLFSGATSLVSAENLSLPATTLANRCYLGMFQGCTSLTIAPALPATTLVERCYQLMFDGCESLTRAPQLPATTLANNCYYMMFRDCTSLTTAPALPATTLAERCYQYMFINCQSLTTAPELSATTLVDYCYYMMFSGCYNLSEITCLATDISATDCTLNWVNNVSEDGTFTKASSMSGWTRDINGIPYYWTVQNA